MCETLSIGRCPRCRSISTLMAGDFCDECTEDLFRELTAESIANLTTRFNGKHQLQKMEVVQNWLKEGF